MKIEKQTLSNYLPWAVGLVIFTYSLMVNSFLTSSLQKTKLRLTQTNVDLANAEIVLEKTRQIAKNVKSFSAENDERLDERHKWMTDLQSYILASSEDRVKKKDILILLKSIVEENGLEWVDPEDLEHRKYEPKVPFPEVPKL